VSSVKLALNPYGLAAHYADPSVVARLAQLGESAGFDQFVLTDHVAMSVGSDQYPYGPWPTPLDFPWWEPMTTLAVVAGATHSIGLTTGVLISPLRSAVLLAKQAATLDQLSGGRFELGIGVGWQEAEFVASGVPFATRKAYFVEHLRVMKLLWQEPCVTFRGDFIDLDRIYSSPHPQQAKGIPVSVGVAPTPSNLSWLVELADGYLPIEDDPEVYAPHFAWVRQALFDAGRDPEGFIFRVRLRTLNDATGQPGIRETFQQLPRLEELGATAAEFYPFMFLRGNSPHELEDVIAECGQLMRED